MRKRFAFGLALMSFVLGAWLSPRVTAVSSESLIPVAPERGQRILISTAASSVCEVERASAVVPHWVQCKDGTWRNLTNGSGYLVEKTK